MGKLSKRRGKPDGPIAALGYARKLRPSAARPTDKWMRKLRAIEEIVNGISI